MHRTVRPLGGRGVAPVQRRRAGIGGLSALRSDNHPRIDEGSRSSGLVMPIGDEADHLEHDRHRAMAGDLVRRVDGRHETHDITADDVLAADTTKGSIT